MAGIVGKRRIYQELPTLKPGDEEEDFTATLLDLRAQKKLYGTTRIELQDLIDKIKGFETGTLKKTHSNDYRIIKRYQIVVSDEGREELFLRQGMLKCVPLEDMFSVVRDVHLETKHGSRDKVRQRIKERGLASISRHVVELYLYSACPECNERRKSPKKSLMDLEYDVVL